MRFYKLCNIWQNKTVTHTDLRIETSRLSQQPALGALPFLRSFVAGKANFCSHLLAPFVHFTVVKSQAVLFVIRLGVTELNITLFSTKLCQWRNSQEVIKWFSQLKDKQSLTFLVFDIVDFYPSISQDLLMKSLRYAS